MACSPLESLQGSTLDSDDVYVNLSTLAIYQINRYSGNVTKSELARGINISMLDITDHLNFVHGDINVIFYVNKHKFINEDKELFKRMRIPNNPNKVAFMNKVTMASNEVIKLTNKKVNDVGGDKILINNDFLTKPKDFSYIYTHSPYDLVNGKSISLISPYENKVVEDNFGSIFMNKHDLGFNKYSLLLYGDRSILKYKK